jgi:hypothetical protein
MRESKMKIMKNMQNVENAGESCGMGEEAE